MFPSHRPLVVAWLSLSTLFGALPALAQDGAESLMQSLTNKTYTSNPVTYTPAEEASMKFHQQQLLDYFSTGELVSVGFSAKEAALFRQGIAYSDMGKLGPFKQWLTTESGFTVDYGRPEIGTELLAVLQGKEGRIWKSLPEETKAFYEPLVEMLGASHLNPKLSAAEARGFFASREGGAAVGYYHEFQGLLASFLDFKAGKIQATLQEYREVLFASIYAHNGDGPSRQEFESWFEQRHGRAPREHELPFWTKAHEMVRGASQKANTPIFEDTVFAERYSKARNAFGIFHRIRDRVDGALDPRKISREIRFLGPRTAFLDVYFAGNRFGVESLIEFTADTEVAAMEKTGTVDKGRAKVLRDFIDNQRAYIRRTVEERSKVVRLFVGDERIGVDKVADRLQEVTRVDFRVGDAWETYQFSADGKALQTAEGKDALPVVEDLFERSLRSLDRLEATKFGGLGVCGVLAFKGG